MHLCLVFYQLYCCCVLSTIKISEKKFEDLNATKAGNQVKRKKLNRVNLGVERKNVCKIKHESSY